MKDTVQLEDLLSKPVLADPESVFSEPSFHYNRTPSVSNKSPSADSDVRPTSQVYSESEPEHFRYPSSPKKKSSSEESPSASQSITPQRLTRDAISVKQKHSPKSRKSSRKKEKSSSAVDSQRPQEPRQHSIRPSDTKSAAKDISSKDNLSKSQGTSELDELSPDMSNETLNHNNEEDQPSINTAQSQNRELKAQKIVLGGAKIDKNVHQEKGEEQRKKNQEEKDDSINSAAIPKDNKSNRLEPLESKSKKEQTDKENQLMKLAREPTSVKEKGKKIPLEKLVLTETPSLHTFIANPNSSRLRKARENNQKTCEPRHQQSILTPGRCSFSHEAGHTANGNSKSFSPLINRSSAKDHRLRSEGSASLSPVTSPSPTNSADVFRKMYSASDETDSVISMNETEGKINHKASSRNSAVEEYEGKIPIQIAATVDGTAHELAATNIQTNLMQAPPNTGKKSINSERQMTLRRSFSQDETETSIPLRDSRTFSLNLHIDFHFQNVQTTCNTKSLTHSRPNNADKNSEATTRIHSKASANASTRNIWPDLGKTNEPLASNDATRLELDHKKKILEKSFAEKTAKDLMDANVPVNRKRRSEPVMVDISSSRYDSMLLCARRSSKSSSRTQVKRNSSRRSEKNRRSYTAGEKIVQHSGVNKVTHKTEFNNAENKSQPLNGGECKRRRFQTSGLSSDTTESVPMESKNNSTQNAPVFKEGPDYLDKKPREDKVTQNEPRFSDFKSKEVIVISNANTDTGFRNRLPSTKSLPEAGCEPIKRNVIDRRLTAPARISSDVIKIMDKNITKTDAQIPEITKSDPGISEKTVGSSEATPLVRNFTEQDIHDKCTPDNQHRQVKNMLEMRSRSQSPGPKPKPKPRGGITSKSPVQSQSFETKAKTPKARPRISKSVERDSAEVMGKDVHGTAPPNQQSTEELQQVSLPPSNTVGESKFKTKDSTPSIIIDRQISQSDTSKLPSQSAAKMNENAQTEKDQTEDCVMRKGSKADTRNDKQVTVPEIEVSDDSDYDNPWDSLDEAVQRASIRYNRRPSRIAAGADTKTLLLQSAEDLGRLLEEAEKRRQLRHASTKSSCPDGETTLSPDSAAPTTLPFTRFSPLRHTVKGLVSQPLRDTSKSNDNIHQDFPTSKHGAHHKNDMPNRAQSLQRRSPYDVRKGNVTEEDEQIQFRSHIPGGVSPPRRPQSLSAQEIAKMMSPQTKKRKY